MKQSVPAGWILEEKKLSRTLLFPNFPSAISFIVKVSFFCEKMNHHPEWKNVYNKIFIDLTTHDSGGVSEKDYQLALFINNLFEE
jgi:4a-hydroxytetrahydrobiopterin dehydratase